MCLPKCGPTDTPRRYRVPSKVKQELPFTGNDEQHTRQHSPDVAVTEVSSYDAYLPFTEQFSSNDTIDCVAVPTEDSQASLRREKSRIAAKVRRQKENQSLVRLRLTLPIHAAKTTHTPHIRRPAETYSSLVDDDNDSSHGDRLDRFALCEVSSYRAACSVSRQQQLAAPEFEKAVTIRLAGNSLCLYNWLYPEEHSDPSNTSTFCDTARAFGPLGHQPQSAFSQPSLSLWSQSLIALVVDTAENTVVFAPPSYSQLIGLPWNSIIGLQLPELRARQFVAAAAVSNSPSPKLRTVKPLLPQNRSTDSSSSMRWSPDACFPITGSATCSLSNSSDSEKSERCALKTSWPVAFGDRYSHLTTLIPPDSSLGSPTLSNPLDSNTGVLRASLKDYPSVHVICWASYLLSSCSQKPGARCFATSHRQLSSVLSDHLANSGNDSYPAACTLRVFLFNPITNPATAKRAQDSSPSPIIPVSCLTDSPVDGGSVNSHAGLASSPRSYHLWDSLKFVGAQPSFLSALDHSQADLLDHTLLDFVHPDDLESVADALNSLSEAEPVITTLHRLRSKSGAYRWARFLAFLTRRDSAQLLGSLADLSDSSCCASHSTEGVPMMRHPPTACSSSLGVDLSSRKRSCSGECNSSARLCCDDGESQDAAKNTTCQFWLICCHQFVHFDNDHDVPHAHNLSAPIAVLPCDDLSGHMSFDHEKACIPPNTVCDMTSSMRRLPRPSCSLKRKRSTSPESVAYSTCTGETFHPAGSKLSDVTYQPSLYDPSDDHLCDLQDLELNWKSGVQIDGGVTLANSAEFVNDKFRIGHQIVTSDGGSVVSKLEWTKQAPSIVPETHEFDPGHAYKPYSSADSNGTADVDSLMQTPNSEISCSRSYSVCSLTSQDEFESTLMNRPFNMLGDVRNDPFDTRVEQFGQLLPQAEIFSVPQGYFFTQTDLMPDSSVWSSKRRRSVGTCWVPDLSLSDQAQSRIYRLSSLNNDALSGDFSLRFLPNDYTYDSLTDSYTPDETPLASSHYLLAEPCATVPSEHREKFVLRQL